MQDTSKHRLVDIVQLIIAVLVFVLTVLQFQQSERQARMAEVQTAMAQRQEEVSSVQHSLDLLMFIREYINGYVYFYDMVPPESVIVRVNEIRRVGLPAIAVPSQYSSRDWLIISHSLGHFQDLKSAEQEILTWRDYQKARDNSEKSRYRLLEYFVNKWRKKGKDNFVFFYKADIVLHKDYFQDLAGSNDFLVSPK